MQVTPRTYAKRYKDKGLAAWQKTTNSKGAGIRQLTENAPTRKAKY